MERQAPRQIMYENQLPLAIESKSTRRLFFPEGGSTYGPTGGGANPNIIRIPINADSLLDVQHSYLQFVLNFTSDANSGYAPDYGVPFIRRLRIESAGTTLEDIEEYGKLYGGVLFPCQAQSGAVQDASITTPGIGETAGDVSDVVVAAFAKAGASTPVTQVIAATNTGDRSAEVTTAIEETANAVIALVKTGVDALTTNGQSMFVPKHNQTNAYTGTNKYVYNVPLVSALFNMDKYLPLVMMNAGLTLELELDVAGSMGLQTGTGTSVGPNAGDEAPEWTISDVRYVAHLIDLQRDFYDKMRMVMEGSGGVLQLAGSTFRHYAGITQASQDATDVINIPSRVKSIKSVFFTQTPSTSKAAVNEFGVSNSLPNGLDSFQFRVGSVVYPPTSVKIGKYPSAGGVAATRDFYFNKGEAYCELRKAFGTLGAYNEGGVLLNDKAWFGVVSTRATCAGGGTAPQTPIWSPCGMDFEAFPKTALESGINTADRSLPMSLELIRSAGANVACNVDVWAMCDAIFYINLDGSVSVSV